MIIKCTEQDAATLKQYLQGEYAYNTFFLADLRLYGVTAPFQDTWADMEGGVCRAVYMRFYENLMVYGDRVDGTFVKFLLKTFPISVIMGKQILIQPLLAEADGKFSLNCKQLYLLEDASMLPPVTGRACKAEIKDAARIHRFLLSLPEFVSLYASGAMIEDRIRKNDGIHLFIAQGHQIAAHGNSTACAERTVMLGGIGTAPDCRRMGLATEIVCALSRAMLEQGKKPCAFCGRGAEDNLFCRIGYRPVGAWATLERIGRH